MVTTTSASTELHNDYTTSDSLGFEYLKLSAASFNMTFVPAPSFGFGGPTHYGDDEPQPPFIKSLKVTVITPSKVSFASYALSLWVPVHVGVTLPVNAESILLILLGLSEGNLY